MSHVNTGTGLSEGGRVWGIIKLINVKTGTGLSEGGVWEIIQSM